MPELPPKGFSRLSRTIGTGGDGPQGKGEAPAAGGNSRTSCPDTGPGYAELQCTSNFSFLRGASHPDELVRTAAALGHQAIAITDRNSVAGLVRAHQAATAVGIRLVVGVRLDLRDGTSLLAYPQDRAAYGRLTRLLTLGKRRAPKGECHLDYADVVARGEGQVLVVLPPADGDVGAFRSAGRGGFCRPCLSCRASPLSRRRRQPPRPPCRPGRRQPGCRSSRPATCCITCPSGGRCRMC